MPYTVTVAPVMTSVAPSSGSVSTIVTITGKNFGSTKNASTITFNGVAGTPSSWSTTTIVVAVPNGALTGNVVVTVNGQASPPLPFLIHPGSPQGVKFRRNP